MELMLSSSIRRSARCGLKILIGSIYKIIRDCIPFNLVGQDRKERAEAFRD